MKKAKILALAALLACSAVIASCSEAASSSGDSSPVSSESGSASSDDTSDYTGSEDLSEDSGSEDSTAAATYEIAEINNYAPSYVSGLTIAEGDAYAAGEEVTYTFASNQYVSESTAGSSKYWYYITVNGETYNPSTVTTTADAYYTEYSGTFVMPAQDVSIDIVYASNTVSDTDCISASFQNDAYVSCLSLSDASYSVNGTLYLILEKAAGVSVSSVSYSTDNGTTWLTGKAIAGTYTNGGNSSPDIVYTTFSASSYFTAGNSVVFKADYTTDNATYGLHITNPDAVTVTTGSYYSESMIAGESVYLVYKGADGYYISGLAEVKDASGNEVSTSTNTAATSATGSSYLGFTMPAYDVYITFSVGSQIAVEAAQSDALSTQIAVRTSYTSSDNDVSYVTPGAYYYICAYPKDGYILSGFNINGTQYTTLTTISSYNITYYRYQVPSDAASLEISAIASQGYVVSHDIDSKYASVKFGSSTASTATYASGDSVTATVTPTAYYSINTVTVKDEGGSEITATVTPYSSYSTVSFTMPAKAVTISATFKENAMVTLSLSMNETAAGSYDSVSIYGDSSNASLESASASASFIDGETVYVYIYNVSTSYDWSVYSVYSSGSKTQISTSVSSRGILSGSFTVSSDMNGIYIEAGEKQALNITYNIAAGITATYGSSSSATYYASSLTTSTAGFPEAVYSGYYCYVHLETSAEGKTPSLSVTDANGASVDVTSNVYEQSGWYEFIAPSTAFTVTATIADSYTVTVVNDEGLNVLVQDLDNSYADLTENSTISAGHTVRIYNYRASATYYYVDFENTSVEDLSGSLGSYKYVTFTASSNMTIYLSSSEISL